MIRLITCGVSCLGTIPSRNLPPLQGSAANTQPVVDGAAQSGRKDARKDRAGATPDAGELDADGTSAAAMALPVDQMQLLDEYARLSPAHQQMVRETITAIGS